MDYWIKKQPNKTNMPILFIVQIFFGGFLYHIPVNSKTPGISRLKVTVTPLVLKIESKHHWYLRLEGNTPVN